MKPLIQTVSETLDRELDQQRFLLVGNAQRKRTAFLYEPNATAPSIIVRIPGHWDTVSNCQAEHEGLREFARLDINGMLAPEALGTCTLGDTQCFLQRFLPSSQWMGSLPNQRKIPVADHISKATSHLIDLFHASKRTSPDDPICNAHCFQHRDFWLGNLGWQGRTLVLYDFEYARPDGYPLFDLLHFVLYYRVALRNRKLVRQNVAGGEYQRDKEERNFALTTEDINTVLVASTSYRNMVCDAIARYCGACGIDSDTAGRLVFDFIENQVENSRGLKGMSANWAQPITDQIKKRMES
ncbi:MAG: hypothetical protein VCD00_09920 [Candidatus Hydrogenedentota bacterium]